MAAQTNSSAVSSGLNLSTSYFMRNFYANNRNSYKKSGRNDYSNIELSFEDSRALCRAVKRLPRNDYGSAEDKKDTTICDTSQASIEAFVETYNNTIDSGKHSDDHDTQHYIKRLKTLSRKYKDDLEDIGISIESDGKLSINKDRLKVADNSKARKLFSSEGDYSKKALTIAKKLNSAITDDLYAQINKKGLHINITV